MIVEVARLITRWKCWVCLACLLLIPFSGNAVTPMIAACQNESLFLNSDGSVWGTGNVANFWPGATSPVRILQLPNVIAIATGGYANYALLADGTLWGLGNNNTHQLADGTAQGRSQPQRIPGLSDVKAFSAASFHRLALKNDGTVWGWGNNESGQLGDGTRTDRDVPVQVSGLTNVTRIAAGRGPNSLALKSDGTVWVWGNNCCGQAGNGAIPVNPTDPENNHLIPTQVLNLDRVIAIAGGSHHHMALRDDGTVWSWGRGDLGQNGTGRLMHELLPVQVQGLEQVIAIDANTAESSFALKADGTVWAWGSNSQGLLGVTGISYSAAPVQVPGLSDIAAISVGENHVVAMRTDGTILAWGGNASGELGDGTLQDRIDARAVTGPGGSGQLNLLRPAPTVFNRLPQAQISLSVASGRAPLSVTVGVRNASDPDGTITAYYWTSADGQQATGSTATFAFTQAGTYLIDLLIEDNSGARGHAAQSIVVAPAAVAAGAVSPKVGMGEFGGIALADDGRILTWGGWGDLGSYGSLPYVERNSIPFANGIAGAVDIAKARQVVHVLMADGTVLGWGSNGLGEVGSGSTATWVYQPELLPDLPPVQALATNGHGLALTRDGRVFAWGRNTAGQLGLGDYQNRFQPVEVPGMNNVTAIAAGVGFSVALKTDGTVWGWGVNLQLGGSTSISLNRPIQIPGLTEIKRIFATDIVVIAQDANGAAWISGSVGFPFAPDPGGGPGVRRFPAFDGLVKIAGRTGTGRFIVALKADGTVWTGGLQISLALGHANSGDIAGLAQLPGIADAIDIAAGQNGAMALRRDGTVLAWGLNNYAQIGDGTLAYQQTPVLVVNETGNGFLDLIPEVANTIPRNLIPPFLLATYADGSLSSTTLYADLRGIISSGSFASNDFGEFAAGYNVYVAADVPALGASSYFQLNANNSWSALQWPMAEFLSGVALDNQDAVVRAQILQNADLSSPQLAGASILVGYGTDPDEMLRNARYRTIFTVTQP